MAIRRSTEERIQVDGTVDEWYEKSIEALKNGGFGNIKPSKNINQITADYKKFTVWGSIVVTLTIESEITTISIKVTANVDNIYALFSSPIQKIFDQYKNNLG